jgi:hypothetical protein
MLSSMLFRSDAKLQAAAANHAFHVTRGAHGSHVSRIQLALLLLGFNVVDDREWRFGLYGESTAAAVLAYKSSRHIVNRAYQQQADNIVGVMTILQLDKELNALASCLPARSYRPPTNGIRDSAAHFELRRCISLLRERASLSEPWSDTIMAGRGLRSEEGPPMTGIIIGIDPLGLKGELTDLMTAEGNYMVGPRPGGERARICQLGKQQVEKRTFDQVKQCWDVVETKRSAPEPMDIHWCGIYVADIWRRTGFEKILSWVTDDKERPGINKDKRPLTNSHNLSMLAPGDILIDLRPVRVKVEDPERPGIDTYKETRPFHHMLILEVSRDRKFANILQGNSGGKPPRSSLVTRAQLPLDRMNRSTHSFISVDTLRDPGLTYP